MRKKTVVAWNVEYVKGLKKEDFVKEFAEVYPSVDLSAEYDLVVGKEKKDDKK